MGKLLKAALMSSGNIGTLMVLAAELDVPKKNIGVILDTSGSMRDITSESMRDMKKVEEWF